MSGLKGLPVAGYQPQSPEKVALVNEFKADEERLLRKIDNLMKQRRPGTVGEGNEPIMVPVYDLRWAAIARTHFEQGFMALNRSVFQPQRIDLPEDMANDQSATAV